MSQLANALDALRRGFKIHPCKPKTKIPATIHGVYDQTRNEDQIRKWWTHNPDYNPAVNAGVVVDCDEGLKTLEEALTWAKNAGLPPTLVVRSGRRTSFGAQFHFTGETDNKVYKRFLSVSGEIRCKGEYGMGPGAIHPETGERYEIVVDLPIAPWPENSYLDNAAKENTEKLKANPKNTLKSGEKIMRSERQFWLVSQCGRLRNTGLHGDALQAALRALCDEYCESPEEKTDKMLKQIRESGEHNYGVNAPDATELNKADAWLNDKDVEPPALADAVDSLAQCDPLEIDQRLAALAKRLGVRQKPLSKSVSDRRKKLASERRLKTTGKEVAVNSDPGKLAEMVRQAEEILHGIGMKYFERNAELVHPIHCRDSAEASKKAITKDDSGRDVVEFKGYRRDAESMIIQVASYQTLVMDLDCRASFWISGKDGVIRCHVPKILPGHLHNRVKAEIRSVPYPTLKMVTSSPVLLPSGNATTKVFEEGVLFVPPNRNLYQALPEKISKSDAVAAMKQFETIFNGFPFVDPEYENRKRLETASYSVALSGVLSIVARPYLHFGPVPLHTVTASTPRYGKTKIAKADVAAATGQLPTTAQFVDEEEFGKHLLPLMRAGDRSILIDNVERTLQGSKLCILITENVMRDRILARAST